MILVAFGTTGELIKLAPVLLRLRERGHRYVLATTGQQVQQIPTLNLTCGSRTGPAAGISRRTGTFQAGCCAWGGRSPVTEPGSADTWRVGQATLCYSFTETQ